MNKKVKYGLAILVALFLSGITHIIPMFLSVPKYVYLNIAGTVLISLLFGPLGAGLYAGLLHLVINNIGMGMGTQLPVVISQMLQAVLLAYLLKASKTKFKIIIVPMFMALISLPINTFVYSIFNNNILEKLRELPRNYLFFLKNGLVDSLLMYILSIVVAIIVIKILHIKES